MGRVVKSEVKKVGDKEVRARVLNTAGNVGEAQASNESDAVAKALKDADRKGKENDTDEGVDDEEGENEE